MFDYMFRLGLAIVVTAFVARKVDEAINDEE